ncbi:unnamed protein product [Cuscuta epithymum]|uniref:Pentatricopeptide repeat-containing protein n=1 Tax=Cuscuta epithymum TaxID=186058 RepID=A0AAV0FF60_9ASTE|nr:unnamed protein product [Cuscuta epithymum]
MGVTHSASNLSNKVQVWVYQSRGLSSLSCIQIFKETDTKLPNLSKFPTKNQFSAKKLLPDTLLSVNGSTSDLDSSLSLFKRACQKKEFRPAADTYHTIILKLGMTGKVGEVEGLCKEMVEGKCPGFEEVIFSLIDAFVRNHRLSEALCVVSYVHLCSNKPASLSVYNKMLDALVKAKKDFKDVVYVYKEMVKAGIVPNTDTLNYLLQALLGAGRADSMLGQYRRMDKKGCKPNSRTFEIVISGLVSSGKYEESLGVLDELFSSGCEPDLSFYASLLPIFCDMNNLEVGMRLFGMMRSSKISPTSSIYGCMIQCLCKNRLVDEALTLVEEMTASHPILDEFLLTSIIDRLCEMNKLSEAKKLLEDQNVSIASPYNVLLQAYVNAGDFDIARHLFDEMFDRDLTDVGSWNILLKHFCECHEINDALKYLGKMIVSSANPNADTYSAIIIGKSSMDEYEEALTLFHKAWVKSWVLDDVSYGQLINCLCRSERYQEAVQVFSLMSSKRRPLNSVSFDLLIRGISGITAQTIKLLSLAYYSGASPSISTLKTIVQGLSEGNKVDDLCTEYCILLINLMLTEGLLSSQNCNALANLLSCLMKNSQLHVILPAVDTFISNSEFHDSSVFSVLIDSLWRGGYRREASKLLDLMLGKGWVPDPGTHAVLMGSSFVEEDGKDAEVPVVCEDSVSGILAQGLAECDH